MINNNENIFEGKRSQQVNASVRAAFVHVVGDLLQSISVLVSALIIFFKVSPEEACKRKKNNPQCRLEVELLCFLFLLFSQNTRWPTPSAPSSSPYLSCAPHSPS